MKFSQMPYKRVELAPALAKLQTLLDNFKAAATPEEAVAAYKQITDYTGSYDTMFTLGEIRHTLDTTD